MKQIIKLVSFILCTMQCAYAIKPIQVDVTSSVDNSSVSIGSTKVPDLFNDLTKASKSFAVFDNKPYQADVTYLGVTNAFQVSSNAAGTEVVLSSPLTGFSRTFTGNTRGQVADRIEDWVLKNGADELAKINKQIAKQSAASINDGNPNSTTATMANITFRDYGFGMADLEVDSDGGLPVGIGIGFNSGTFEADTPSGTLKGIKSAVNIPLSIRFSKHFAFQADFSAEYVDIEGSKIFGGGINGALRIKPYRVNKDSDFGWSITPFGGVSGRGSYDLANGGLLGQGGVVNSIDYRVNKNLILTLGNQVTYMTSIPLAIDVIKLDSNLEQIILKNGIKAGVPFAKRWIWESYWIDTRFMQQQLLSDYYETLGTSMAFRVTKRTYAKLGVNYDFSDDYRAWNIGLSSAWAF